MSISSMSDFAVLERQEVGLKIVIPAFDAFGITLQSTQKLVTEMRYKEGEIPVEMLAVNASNDMLVLTSVIGLLVGVVLFYLGRSGKQMWMWVWGAGLIIFSIYLWFAIEEGFKISKHF